MPKTSTIYSTNTYLKKKIHQEIFLKLKGTKPDAGKTVVAPIHFNPTSYYTNIVKGSNIFPDK